MLITVDRYRHTKDSTASKILLDGEFECYGLEDCCREKKILGKTCIPAGTYKVGVRATGGFHARYTKRFPNLHRGMLEVLDVPNFKYILIHIGNTHYDTAGCLLVGKGVKYGDESDSITSSKTAYLDFYPKVIESALAGNLSIYYTERK